MEHTAPVRKAYPSDLRDAEWAILEPLVPAVKPGGRPARHARREIVNAILYVVRGGNQWRAMPHDLPPWQTAFSYFRLWRNAGTWEQIHTAVRERSRRRRGREATPSAAIVDSQSVKTSQRGARAATTPTSR
jgi:transposase